MRKNKCFVAVLLVLLLFPAINLNAQENVDLIVLLDSSQSMFSYYNEVTEYVISGLVQQYMRFNDTFHLLSFSDTTQIEIAQTVKTEQDIKSVLARLYLLYPLGKNTDLITALRNTEQYVADLPSASTKFIVLITDGVHAPSSASPFTAFSPDEVKAEIGKIAGKMRDQSWIIKIVSVPFLTSGTGTEALSTNPKETQEGSQAPGTGNYLSDLSSSLNASITEFSTGNTVSTVTNTMNLPSATYPLDLGKKNYRFKFPLIIKNPSTTEISLEFSALLANSKTDILEKKQFTSIKPLSEATIYLDIRFPDTWQKGKNSILLEPVLANGVRITPARASVDIDLRHSTGKSIILALSTNLLKIILLLIGIGIGVVVIFYIKSIHKKADLPIIEAVLETASNSPAIKGHVDERKKTASAESVYVSTANKVLVSSVAAVPGNAASNISGNVPGNISANVAGNVSANAPVAETVHNQAINAEILNSYKVPAADATSILANWQASSQKTKVELKAIPKSVNKKLPHGAVTYQPRIIKPGTIRVELIVDEQNPNIGSRNVKTLHSGGKKTMGSGNASDFIIFLLPVPKKLAEIHYDGQSIIIVPKRLEYFPDFSEAKKIELGEKIRIVNSFNRELFISFSRYIPSLDKVNKLLHCIDSPGL